MKKTALIAFIMAAISPFANAQTTPQKGGTCWAYLGRDTAAGSATKFTCDILGSVTVKEIYEKGYRVVAMMQSQKLADIVSIIIEEQK